MNATEAQALLKILQIRFEKNMARHPGLAWKQVKERLDAHPAALGTLAAMEASGGEPDVIGSAGKNGALTWCDCAPESPAGRRSLCYDQAALDARKENKPPGSAAGMAAELGVSLLNEEQYRALQELGEFDVKTSSWIATPVDIRKLGGALFCDRRYGKVFVYHNGVQSYYAARGFRGSFTM